jgi:acyl-CoA thioester hydrolase
MDNTQRYELLIKESHIDGLGHVNNAVYLTLFEEARWDLITQHGYGYEYILKSKISPIVLDVHLRFSKEIKIRERITIVSNAQERRGRKIGMFLQEMINGDGEVCCTGLFTLGVMDLQKRKLITFPNEWLTTLGFEIE